MYLLNSYYFYYLLSIHFSVDRLSHMPQLLGYSRLTIHVFNYLKLMDILL